MFLYNYLCPEAEKFDLKYGPYYGIQNLEKLIEYRNASKVNADWVYSPKEGPFRVLGAERISTIVDEKSNVDAILRLNEAITNLFRDWYEQIRASMKQKLNPLPALPLEGKSYVELSKLYDASGGTLLQNSLRTILGGKAELTTIDELIGMGIDINGPISIFINWSEIITSPLGYLWAYMDYYGEKVTMPVLEHLQSLGADLNQVYGPDANNVITSLAWYPIVEDILPWYVKNKGDINFRNGNGDTALHLYLDRQPPTYERFSCWLIENGADVTLANNREEHPIHILCRESYILGGVNTILSALLEKAPQEIDARDGEGHTPLYWCVRTNKPDLMETIFAHWNKIKYSIEPLELLHAYAEFIAEDSRILFSKKNDSQIFSKKDVEDKINQQYMPLLKAILPSVQGANEGLRKLLITSKEGQSTLLARFAEKCPWILDSLLENNYILPEDLKIENTKGETVAAIGKKTSDSFLLLMACYNLDKITALGLLNEDVDLSIQTQDKQSLLHLLILGCQNEKNKWEVGFKIFLELLKKGANPNCADDSGNTPLHRLIKAENPIQVPLTLNSFVLEIINFGAKTKIENKQGLTARDLVHQFRGWRITKEAVLGAP